MVSKIIILEGNPDGEHYQQLLSPFTDVLNFSMPELPNWVDIGSSIFCLTTLPLGTPMLIFLGILTTFLLGASALVSGAEVAYFSLTPYQLKQLKHQKNSRNQFILKLLDQPQQLLATILISNNLFNIAIIMTSHVLTSELIDLPPDQWVLKFLIEVVAITFVLVLCGEIMPKVYATHQNLKLAQVAAYPLHYLSGLLRPLSLLLVQSSSFFERQIDERFDRTPSKKDISKAIDIVAATSNGEHNKIWEQDLSMLKGIVTFGDITVKQIMCNRVDMFCIGYRTTFENLCKIVAEEGYSRIPVFKGTPDNIYGVLHVKDLLPHWGKKENIHWQELCRPPFFVPENKKIDALLKDIQQRRTHMVVAVDEYGGVSGLITLEDILEEIVGDIQDEFDGDEHAIFHRVIDDMTHEFDAKILLHDMCKLMNLDFETFESIRGDSDSLGGLLLELGGKIPKKNAKLRHENLTFTVKKTKANRIEKVQVEVA